MFESPTKEGASLGANPLEMTGKTEGFEYSLDFWYFLSRKSTTTTNIKQTDKT
jgi:hypothetical protein